MKSMKSKIFVSQFFSLLFMVLSTSCGDEYVFATQSDCDNCIYPKPTVGSLIVNFTEQPKGVALKIYKGLYSEDQSKNNLIYQDTAVSTPFYLDNVDVNEYYSVEATYATGTRKIKVVDGSRLKLYSIQSTCNSDCWIFKGGIMDCKLKF